MLIVLPLLALALLMQLLWNSRSEGAETRWGRAAVGGILLWGVLSVVVVEALAAVGQLRPAALAAAWCLVVVALVAYLRRSRKPLALPAIGSRLRALTMPEKVLLGALLSVVGALAVVALRSPPNTVDSLLYHLPRVRQWAQHGSLAFFPTTYAHQLFMPPWAEMTLVQLRLLFGSDALLNLLQLSAYVLCILGVVSLARSLGAGRTGRWISAAFAASIPMAILQATSTQTDLVVSLWLVLLANLVLWEARPREESTDYWYAGAVLGLGMLTKGTFFPFALPLAAWLVVRRLRRDRLRVVIVSVVGMAALAVLVNVPHWSRTTAAFGNPLGPTDVVQANLQFTNDTGGVAAGVLRAEARMIGRNLMTPLPVLNREVARLLDSQPAIFGPDYGKEMLQGLWNHEDTAGNPVHAALAFLVIIVALSSRGEGGDPVPRVYAGVVLAGYLLLPLIFTTGSELVGLRFQLSFLILAAPLVGLVVGRWAGVRWGYAFAGLLIVFSLPWVLFNNIRPIVGLPPNITRTGSVFRVSTMTSLFAMDAGRLDEYQAIADGILETDCRQVGLRIDSHDPEYLFWRLLDSSPSPVVLGHVDPPPELARFADADFHPCAVICTTCGDVESLDGLLLDRRYGRIALYSEKPARVP